MAKLPGVYELMATAASPAINFGRGLLGYQDPFMTQTMQDRMAELEAEKGPTGNVGYEDYGLETATPGGRFTGGLMGLALNNPVDFGLAGSIGRYSYSPQGRTGLTYDFTPDQDTGTTGNAMLDFINAGGLKGAISKMGTAQAAEVTPQNEPMDIEDFLGTSTPQDLGFIGMAPGIKEAVAATGRPTMADIAGPINENLRDLGNPLGDSRVVSEEQGLSGFPGLGQVDPGFQNELDAREARRGQIEMQQNPDYGQFFDAAPLNEEKKGINLGGILNAAALFGGPLGFAFNKPALSLAGAIGNVATGRTGRALDAVSKGLGSLGSKFARKMRGYNPVTGRTNTQSQYEAAREARRTQSRIDNMLERKAKGLSYSQKNLDRLSAEVNKGINQREAAALADKNKSTSTGVRTDIDVADGGAEAGGSSKIVCTMMNERYGFGSFRNKIWMKFHEHHGPEYQKGYHAIFLPLVKIAKGEGKINTAVRKVLEHMGRHVTADMFKIMKGKKRDTLGRIYRAIFEPACHIIGKIKSALGRG